jgi:hypothetical protein
MAVNWARIFNRLWELINPTDQTDPTYFSGGRFISTVREIDAYFPDYGQYINQRRTSGKITSRKDYFMTSCSVFRKVLDLSSFKNS